VFIRVYRLEIQSDMLVFSTLLCELLPLKLSLWFNSPLPPSLSQAVYITNRVYGWKWVWCGKILLKTIFCRSLTLCICTGSEPTKLLDHPEQKPRRGGGLRQKKTPAASPFTGPFSDDDI
jgi:hypothetical protein